MARNASSNTVATMDDIRRAVATASAPKKGKKKSKRNSGGSGGALVANASTSRQGNPSLYGRTSGSIKIVNSEYIGDITATSGSTNSVSGYDVNPNSSIFAWLNKIAAGYEKFRFTKLHFVYTPICPSSTTGMIVMAYDYDASDNPPASKTTMSAYGGSVRGNVWNKLRCPMTIPPGWFFVGQSTGSINPLNTDIKFYDQSRFYMGVFNATATLPVGELSVEYEVEFSQPDISPIAPLSDVITFTSTSTTAPFGTAQNVVGNLPLTFTNTTSGNGNITFSQGGSFLIELEADLISSAGPAGSVISVLQADPGAAATFFLTTALALYSSYPGASASYKSVILYTVNAVANTVLQVTLNGVLTAFNITKLRVMPSKG